MYVYIFYKQYKSRKFLKLVSKITESKVLNKK